MCHWADRKVLFACQTVSAIVASLSVPYLHRPSFNCAFCSDQWRDRVWSVARSDYAIKENFDRGIASAETGLVANWRFEENLKSTVAGKALVSHGQVPKYPAFQQL